MTPPAPCGMAWRRSAPLWIFLSFLLANAGGGRPVRAQTFPFLTYSIEQGLSESVAYDLLEDRSGQLWVATGFGLNRFDGFGFTTFYTADGLTENKIHSLFEDDQGRIWIGLDRGVNLLEADTIRFVPHLAPLSGSRVSAISQDRQGRHWFGTEGDGLWVMDENERSLRAYTSRDGLPDDHVQALAVDASGRVWIATRAGLSLFEDPQQPDPTETGFLTTGSGRCSRTPSVPTGCGWGRSRGSP